MSLGKYARGLPQGLPSDPVLTWTSPKDPSIVKVTFGNEWEVTTTPKRNELSVLRVQFPEHGPVTLSFVENEWVLAYRNAQGHPRLYNPKNGAPPHDVAPHIQKAYEAMDFLQNKHGIMNIDINGFEKLYELKTRADSVLEGTQHSGSGLGLKTQTSAPPQAHLQTQLAGQIMARAPIKHTSRPGV